MTTVNTSTGSTVGGAAGGSGSVSLSSNTFLQLMIAQLKNQDPTSPTDTGAYMQQLASMTQVEQATNTNKKLDDVLSGQALNQTISMIGRTVTSADGNTTGTIVSAQAYADGTIATVKTKEGKEDKVMIEPGVKFA